MRILLPCLLILTASCQQPATHETAVAAENKVSTDSLINNWNKAWNSRDSAAIVVQFSDDAVLLSSAKTMNGKSEIAGRFVSHFYKSMQNLKTQKVYENTAGNIAIQSGTYTHDIQTEAGAPKTLSGGYTFVWEAQADKSWKLRFLELE